MFSINVHIIGESKKKMKTISILCIIVLTINKIIVYSITDLFSVFTVVLLLINNLTFTYSH